MFNLKLLVIDFVVVLVYRDCIMKVLFLNVEFELLMILYLIDVMIRKDVKDVSKF